MWQVFYAALRQAYANGYPWAKSTIDRGERFNSAADFPAYFPRAMQIGFLAPFPRDWFGQGRIVPVGDASGVANGVLALMAGTHQEKAALAVRYRARIAENFGIDRVLARYADFYQELNEQRKQRTSGQ